MRYELSDYEWSVIKPMLPNKPRGIPRVDDRRILNGIFLGLGAPWRDLPESCLSFAPPSAARTSWISSQSREGASGASAAAECLHLALCRHRCRRWACMLLRGKTDMAIPS
jgi:transposase